MRRNTIRIVCNPYTAQISYYFKGENGEWDVLSGDSPLSREYYTNTTIRDKATDILAKADEIYNRKNKGLDILFEGTTSDFLLLSTEKENIYGRDITTQLGTTKIAVVGKKSVGKTSLIEGLENLNAFKYSTVLEDGYRVFRDECNHAEWYEIDGIDLGREKIDDAFSTITELAKSGLTAVIYCISASSGRIEEIEKNLISKISNCFAQITVMVVLTMCYKDDVLDVVDEIAKITDHIKSVPTLAKPYKTVLKDENGSSIYLEPFGLDLVSKYVFEGR